MSWRCDSRKILVAALMLVSISCIVPAAHAQSVNASVGNATAAPGTQSVEVPISVSTVTGLGIIAADIELTYDSSRLNFASASVVGTLAQSWGSPPVNSSTPGSLRIAMYGVSDLAGSGKLLKLFFNVNASASTGSSVLGLTRCRFNDGATVVTVPANGTFTVMSATPPRISSSTPPHGYVDPLEDKDVSLLCNSSSTNGCRGLQDITITFSEPVTTSAGGVLTAANFQVKYFRNGAQVAAAQADLATQLAPSVALSAGSGAGPYTLHFTPRIPLGVWTQIEVANVVNLSGTPISGVNGDNKRSIGFLPMDLTQDGKVLGDDINRWLLILNGGYPVAPLTSMNFCDQKRNGILVGEDITRAIQLINGTSGTTLRSWNGFDMGAPP